VSPRGLDTTGRSLDPQAEGEGGAEARAKGNGSSSSSDEFGGQVVEPEKGAEAGSAVESVDFSQSVSNGEADVQAVVRDSRVLEVLEEIDRDLIALEPVKKRIREIAALLVIDRLREQMDLSSERPTLHMSFTGRPGTGKTTVAFRMATILHRLGYVEKGHLVTVTRDDLVGQYVGHTAPKTKDAVKRALGGVLFIDEAYYLHRQDNERDYGQEAIEILLQIMEAERDNLVVVLAGYRDRMDEFFLANPGMGSRVAHHIDFPDYSQGELMQIAGLMLERQNYELTDEATEAFGQYVERRMRQPRFANGRSIRNAIDRARLRQASRLVERGERLERHDLVAIEAEDILKSSVFDEDTPENGDEAGTGRAGEPAPSDETPDED
jgi:probable Rubsico expression protein CbbX